MEKVTIAQSVQLTEESVSNEQKIGNERLLHLANHLESGVLSHDKFDFSAFHKSSSLCGTAGCALGECPTLWPNDWKFSDDGEPVLFTEISGFLFYSTPLASAMTWFKLPRPDAAEHLFVPYLQNVKKYGGIHLNRRATKESVAANIRHFVQWRNNE